MLPSEMIILMAIGVDKNSGKTLLARPMDVTSEYIGYLYNSLVSRGFLEKHGATNYQLTPLGRKAISDFLNKNGSRSADVIKKLQLLGIDVVSIKEQKISKLEMEAIKVK